MTDLEKQNQSFYQCTVFLRELYKKGARHVVISPGSRSTPLTLAAAVHPGFHKHIILDERSAGFTALGIGKATGSPAILISTSGTATANYYPAVIEARQSGVPLLLATADRPSHLRNTDANQTIDQLNIFGKFTLAFHNLAEPTGDKKTVEDIAGTANLAIDQSKSRKEPVHLNFPFSKPLEPEPEYLERIAQENRTRTGNRNITLSENKNHIFYFDDEIRHQIQRCERPLIVTGQLTTNQKVNHLFELADQLKAPVLSEQGISDMNYAIQGFDGFLRNSEISQGLEPDLVFRFGSQPASKSLLFALQKWEPKTHIYCTDASHPTTTSLPATHTLKWDGNPFEGNESPSISTSWIEKWQNTENSFFEKKGRAITEYNELTDGHIYEHLVPQIPIGWSLFFSNSFPARDRSLFGKWSTQKVFTNRGASGIDGITSTAMGVNIGLNKPGILFTGDLAFLHDTNALLNQKLLQQPLVVVVINNKGGSIFRMLPIADYELYFADYFETPQDVDIKNLVGSYKLPFQRIRNLEDLNNFALSDFITETDRNLYILECQTDPDASMQLRKKLWDQR